MTMTTEQAVKLKKATDQIMADKKYYQYPWLVIVGFAMIAHSAGRHIKALNRN